MCFWAMKWKRSEFERDAQKSALRRRVRARKVFKKKTKNIKHTYTHNAIHPNTRQVTRRENEHWRKYRCASGMSERNGFLSSYAVLFHSNQTGWNVWMYKCATVTWIDFRLCATYAVTQFQAVYILMDFPWLHSHFMLYYMVCCMCVCAFVRSFFFFFVACVCRNPHQPPGLPHDNLKWTKPSISQMHIASNSIECKRGAACVCGVCVYCIRKLWATTEGK